MHRFVVGLSALLSATAVSAQHAAHEHGVAELRVAIEGAEVRIEFETPLDGAVGFEHAPRTDKQRKALAEAEAALGEFERLFALPAPAGCTPVSASLDSPWASDGAVPQDGGETHSDFVVSYVLRCVRPKALNALQVKVFDVFPRTRRIRAERVSPRGQSAATLTEKQRMLPL